MPVGGNQISYQFKEEFLMFLKKYGFEYDEKYVWD